MDMADLPGDWQADGAGWRLGDRYAEECECTDIEKTWQGGPHIREKVDGTDEIWIHYYADEITKTIVVLAITGIH